MMLNKVTMKSNDDPKKLFEQLGEIENYNENGTLDNADLMAVLFTVAPAKYQSVLTTLQLEKKDKLALEDLEEAMIQVWRQNNAVKTNTESNKDKLNLTTQDSGRTTRNSNRFKGKCNRCGKQGHMARNCWTDPKNADKRPSRYKVPEISAARTSEKSKELQLANVAWGDYAEAFESDDNEVVNKKLKDLKTETMLRSLPPKGKGLEMLEDPEIFIINTGATQHSTGHGAGLTDLKDAGDSATHVGNGQVIKTKAIGRMPFVTNNGIKGTMGDVQLIPGSPFNLIRGTKLQDLGFKVTGKASTMEYSKDDMSLKFDICINTPKGMVLATRLKRTAVATKVGGASATTKAVSIKTAHEQLGHLSKDATRQVAKQLGWLITKGSLKACESCAIGKAKQKNVKNLGAPKDKSTSVNGRVYLDLTRIVGPNDEKQPLRPNWCMIVDQKTRYKTTSFHEAKSGMVLATCTTFQEWSNQGRPVKILRINNAGENKKLVETLNSKDWKMYPTIEYTARDTPQHNYLAEVAIATVYGRARHAY